MGLPILDSSSSAEVLRSKSENSLPNEPTSEQVQSSPEEASPSSDVAARDVPRPKGWLQKLLSKSQTKDASISEQSSTATEPAKPSPPAPQPKPIAPRAEMKPTQKVEQPKEKPKKAEPRPAPITDESADLHLNISDDQFEAKIEPVHVEPEGDKLDQSSDILGNDEVDPLPDIDAAIRAIVGDTVLDSQHAEESDDDKPLYEEPESACAPESAYSRSSSPTPSVTPEVIEFNGDDDALFEEQLDKIIGDVQIDVEAVKVEEKYKTSGGVKPQPPEEDAEFDLAFEFSVETDGEAELDKEKEDESEVKLDYPTAAEPSPLSPSFASVEDTKRLLAELWELVSEAYGLDPNALLSHTVEPASRPPQEPSTFEPLPEEFGKLFDSSLLDLSADDVPEEEAEADPESIAVDASLVRVAQDIAKGMNDGDEVLGPLLELDSIQELVEQSLNDDPLRTSLTEDSLRSWDVLKKSDSAAGERTASNSPGSIPEERVQLGLDPSLLADSDIRAALGLDELSAPSSPDPVEPSTEVKKKLK